jgi:hypothetical protein
MTFRILSTLGCGRRVHQMPADSGRHLGRREAGSLGDDLESEFVGLGLLASDLGAHQNVRESDGPMRLSPALEKHQGSSHRPTFPGDLFTVMVDPPKWLVTAAAGSMTDSGIDLELLQWRSWGRGPHWA